MIKLKDPRAGVLALSAIHAFSELNVVPRQEGSLRTACLVVIWDVCRDHLEKVLEASSQKKVKPGNFTRMGPHTIATYLAMAMGFHGPTFALLTDCEEEGRETADTLLLSGLVDQVCLILATTNGCSVCLIPSCAN